MLLAVLSKRKAGDLTIRGQVYASDANPALINVYTCIRDQPDELITSLKEVVTEFEAVPAEGPVNRAPKTLAEAKTSKESYYYWMRAKYNTTAVTPATTPTQQAAQFIFLNKTCFRGVYRTGPNGFNVPYGHYKNPGIFDPSHLKEVSDLLQGVVLRTAPFETALAAVATGDFVYLDPPYVPETATSFVGYTAEGFPLSSHEELFKRCKEIQTQSKATFLLSNADVKLVRDAFPVASYEVQTVSARRAIHSKNPESKTKEVLIRPIEVHA